MGDSSHKHLAWKCRRGMLELDLLLTRFYQEQFPHLSPQEQAVFAALLEEDDPVLASWLFGSAQPANPHFAKLINKFFTPILTFPLGGGRNNMCLNLVKQREYSSFPLKKGKNMRLNSAK